MGCENMQFYWAFLNDAKTADALSVRQEVFVQEQGFSAENEFDDTDAVAWHLVGYDNAGKAVCAARLFTQQEGVWHAGRIAVVKAMRGQGAGRDLINAILAKARTLNARTVVLGAQHDKAGFYEKCGFVRTGHEYLDEGYLHVDMQITL